MYGVCGCCGALRPRYKRLVDNIFPEDPEDGLVKANMEKLTFYALSAPEKLDRIGAYLSERLSRDVARHRYGYVCIAMEALDQLLMACHCQSINLFVESFLTMVRKLLEADKPNLQILGTNSFVKFANIEEDTASYHRSYDFFISRFSEMCHSSYEDPDIRTKIRMAGIRGLQGVVRKTVNDELQANIWDPQHMDKIVPSLLFNLQQDQIPDRCAEGDKDGTVDLTERCLRELLGRAVYGNIKNAVKPVLMHLDNHSLWEGKSFAVRCFKIIMYSIQSQHSHLVIQQLLGHLDANSKSSATVRAGIVEVISEAAVIEASGSIGPTVLEVFNTLLKQLRLSVDYELGGGCSGSVPLYVIFSPCSYSVPQGSFAGTLPTYQRSEVMLFIMGKIPVPGMYPTLGSSNSGFEGSRMIQIMLLKSLLQVTVGFQTTNMLTALPSSFLDPLLSFTLMEDAEIRLLVLEILISLIDRHENQLKFSLRVLTDISVLKLKMDKCSRQDNLFMKKHSQRLYRHVYLACREENSEQQHFQSLFTLLGLICVELANEEVVVDLIRLALALQDLAVTEEALPVFNRCAVHALSAAYLNLISQLTTVPTFCQHVHEVIELRQKEFPFLLPEGVFAEKLEKVEKVEKVEGEFLFSQSKIAETLGGSGYNSDRLVTPYIPQITDGVCVEEQERERRRLVVERFQTAPFEEIAAHCGAALPYYLAYLHVHLPAPLFLPVYEMKFPDLCVY
uniref:EFR3 homolog Ba (S. cerevisiae) n=1 Tax=Astyanax mexicanus TaxID=7994 RepID=A0A8B9KTH3_ASTMX